MVSSSVSGGILAGVVSLIMTGVFPLFSKIKRVRDTNVNPMVFNIYYSLGVILFCIVSTIVVGSIDGNDIHFSFMGLISGCILGVGSWLVWLSLTYMGMSHAAAVSSGVASMTGFFEGLAIDSLDNTGLAILGLILIICGISGVAFNELLTEFIVKYIFCQKDENMVHLDWLTPQWLNDIDNDQPNPHAMNRLFRFNSIDFDNQDKTEISPLNPFETDNKPLIDNNEQDETQEHHYHTAEDVKLRATGILFAVLGGFCFGSLAFPEEFASNGTTEVYFLPSFGVGVMLMVILNFIILAVGHEDSRTWHFNECFLPGLTSGIIWAIGFLALLYAELLLDYSLAVPLRECSICVAVIIGIVFFKEITDKRAIAVSLICVAVALCGVFILATGDMFDQ